VFTILLIVHVLICIGLIIVVLMQSAKGEGLAGAFGGGGGISGAVFGGRGAASFLSKATTGLAIVFMISCLGLSFMSSSKVMTGETAAGTSAVTEAAQKDLEAQQQQQQQQQALPQEGDQSANPEDIFNTPAATEADSQ